MFLWNMVTGRRTAGAGANTSDIEQARPKISTVLTSDEEHEVFQWVQSHDVKLTSRNVTQWVKDRFNKQIGLKVAAEMVEQAMTQKIMWRYDGMKTGSLLYPGFGLPLSNLPDKHFPILFTNDEYHWSAATLLIREVCMLKLVEELTNKPDWWTKVRNPEITQRWKEEALRDNPWANYVNHADFTPAMADAVISELQLKADLYEKTGFIPIMDYSAAATKSDTLMTEELATELNAAVAALENVPEDRKHWHPGSNERVLDLVHPSMFPLIYGRSRIVTEKRIGINEALEYCGTGQTIPEPLPVEMQGPTQNPDMPALSNRFQWLPCDVSLNVANGKAKIESYINNLHPTKHAELYPIIEKFIEKSLPAWDIIYRWPAEFETQRLKTDRVGPLCTTPELCEKNYECRASNRPLNEGEEERDEDEEYEANYEESARGLLDFAWFAETHKMDLPDPDPTDTSHIKITPEHVKTSGFFGNKERLQVIVKLANIHLTPDKPSYEGGTWHVEGQLNEHICATALYYYDSDNITDCHLSFRTLADREELVTSLDYNQSDEYSIERTFAIDTGVNTQQFIGSVLTRQGRALFFPNLYMHQVSPFKLADPSRPGHRKILALFLVDPAIPVISTAHVPPQQRDWWAEATQLSGSTAASRLPPELRNMVVGSVDFPIGMEDAKKVMEELMAERSQLKEKTDRGLNLIEWNFCEH